MGRQDLPRPALADPAPLIGLAVDGVVIDHELVGDVLVGFRVTAVDELPGRPRPDNDDSGRNRLPKKRLLCGLFLSSPIFPGAPWPYPAW